MNRLNLKSSELLTKKIRIAQDDIRKKTLALKIANSEIQENIESGLKPVIEPLEKIIKLNERQNSKEKSENYTKITPKKSLKKNIPGQTELSQQKNTDSIVLETPEWDSFQTRYDTPSVPHTPAANVQNLNEIFKNTIPVQAIKEDEQEINRRRSTSNLDYYTNLLHVGDERIDKITGIKFAKGHYTLNRIPIEFKVSNKKRVVEVDGKKFNLTLGINELLFMKQPNDELVTSLDVRNYKNIAESCAFTTDRKLKTLKGQRFLGKGLMIESGRKKDYIYWDNPNELVKRLELLHASRSAGHTGHNNEILSIEEELREGNYIE